LPTTPLPVIMNRVVYTPAPMGQLHQQYAVGVQRQRHYAGLGSTPLISRPLQQHAFKSSIVLINQYRLSLQRQYNPDVNHHDSHPSSLLLPIDLILLAASFGGATSPRPLSNHRNRCWPEHRRCPPARKLRQVKAIALRQSHVDLLAQGAQEEKLQRNTEIR
jgi:hypothetical protein